MPDDRLHHLLAAWPDGALSSEDAGELIVLLQGSDANRRLAARSLLMDRLLRQASAEPLDADLILRALPARRGRRAPPRLWPMVIAAAATILFVFAAWWILVPGYPQPAVSGSVQVVGTRRITRQSRMYTTNQTGELRLGNYCRVDLKPMTRVRLEGTDYKEQLYLAQGDITCEVQPLQGAFTVRTDVGCVTVKGTKFRVELLTRKGSNMDTQKRLVAVAMAVTVMAGSVEVEWKGGTQVLGIGPRQVFAAEEEAPKLGRIEAGKPKRLDRPAKHWKGKARIVGLAQDAPRFKIEVVDAKGKLIKAAKAAKPNDEGKRAYEVEWLKPGVYTVRVVASGYKVLELEKLEVGPNQDLRIDLEFTAKSETKTETTLTLGDLPEAARLALKKRFPKADIRSIKKEVEGKKVEYEVKLVHEKQRLEVELNEQGKITEIAEDDSIPFTDLPKPVQKAVQARFPNAKILEAEKAVKGDQIVYGVELEFKGRRIEVELDSAGKILEIEDD